MDAPLWTPSQDEIARSALAAFAARAAAEWGAPADADYPALHRWSVEHPDAFWGGVWEFCEVIGSRGSDAVVDDADRLPGARWFPDARLNFAENLLRRDDDATALLVVDESGPRERVGFRELRDRVARFAARLDDWGIGEGDRVAGVVPNASHAIVAFLACASRGVIWSSCSPDFGVRGIVDRFGQIAPKAVIGIDAYRYGGKHFDVLPKLRELATQLPSVERWVVAAHDTPQALPDGWIAWDDALAEPAAQGLSFTRLPFDHPLVILFSSGTTGVPKCIVHGAGGTLLQHLKEHRLHADIGRDTRFFYFTTCGWMMWNWLVSGLASEACLVLYDGSPFHPEPATLFDLAERERIEVFGVSAKYLDAVAKEGLQPARSHDLSALRMILSTGSPLSPEGFDAVYRVVAPHARLSSIAGGTDIVSCFVGGAPTLPVHRGEIQCSGLGMAVAVYDDAGRPVVEEKGELVCTRAFPSVPLGFWNDADGSRFRAAYFERFPGVWHHGDFAEQTARGGMRIHGRSDAVLNPGGVRIGTAEIYRQVEPIEEVLEALVIGQDRDDDVRVVLFVRLRDQAALTPELCDEIRRRIRSGASPRHVPAVIAAVPDIPRTKSGKIVELAVREIVHGRPVKNREALANPEALEAFRDHPALSA